jgi:hypothetical protein
MKNLIAMFVLVTSVLLTGVSFNQAYAAQSAYKETGGAVVKVLRVGFGVYRVYRIANEGATLIMEIDKAANSNQNISEIVYKTTGSVVEGIYDDMSDVANAGSVLVNNVAIPALKIGYNVSKDYIVPGTVTVAKKTYEVTKDYVAPAVFGTVKFGAKSIGKGIKWLLD